MVHLPSAFLSRGALAASRRTNAQNMTVSTVGDSSVHVALLDLFPQSGTSRTISKVSFFRNVVRPALGPAQPTESLNPMGHLPAFQV